MFIDAVVDSRTVVQKSTIQWSTLCFAETAVFDFTAAAAAQ